jgi:hypothetical protein
MSLQDPPSFHQDPEASAHDKRAGVEYRPPWQGVPAAYETLRTFVYSTRIFGRPRFDLTVRMQTGNTYTESRVFPATLTPKDRILLVLWFTENGHLDKGGKIDRGGVQ